MDIIFSEHTEGKIEQRRIGRRLVVETVNDYEFKRPGYGGREEMFKKFGKNYLKIVVKVENGQIVIITAHWVAKMKIQ